MKKGFWLTIFALFALLVSPKISSSYAQEIVVETDTPVGVEKMATPESVLKQERVNYELPFPGMLPDNPLYILKVVRDGIVKLLINDDLKMARFSLLNAEKRMFSMKLLVDKNKDKLAIETMSKGNNYLNDSIAAIVRYQKSHPKSIDIKPFLSQLDTSVRKLSEIQHDSEQSIDSNLKKQFTYETTRTSSIGQTVKKLLKHK